MSNELQILNQILEHRLHQADIEQVLAELSGDDKSALLNKVGELLRRLSALMEVSSNVLGSMGLELNPADSPSKIYLQRCEHYRQSPPPPDWGGIWTMTSK